MNNCRAARAVSFVLLVSAALVASSLCGPARAGEGAFPASNPTVSFISPAHCVEPEALCTLQVMVDDAVDSLSCMDISIVYDPALVECTNVLEGKLFKQAGYPTFFTWEKVPPDTVNAVDCLLGYQSYFLPPGELARFVFKAKAPGICPVSFAAIRLWDIDRVELSPVAGAPVEIVVCSSTGNDTAIPPVGTLRNYPNPFNPSTVLTLWLPDADGRTAGFEVLLDIFSVSGEKVRRLFAGILASGAHELVWDGRDDRGAVVAAGVYIGAARTERGVFRHKMIVIR
jgi:hypothetical protein